MAITYELRGNVLCFTTHGPDEFFDGLRTLESGFAEASEVSKSNPAHKWHLLFDVRESTDTRSVSELRDVAALISANRAVLSGRCAILVSKPAFYALARMFGVLMDSFGFTTVTRGNEQEAMDWFNATEARSHGGG